MQYDFTAALENQLDEVSAGDADWKALLREFWSKLKPATAAVLERQGVIDELDSAIGPFLFPPKEDGSDSRLCPLCKSGRLHLKASFKMKSSFIGCSNYPECRYTRGFGAGSNAEGAEAGGDRELGLDPITGQPVELKIGRFRSPMCRPPSLARKSPNARPCPRAGAPRRWSWNRPCACWPCRARSGCTRRTASRSPPVWVATDPLSCTPAHTPMSPTSTRCSRSG